MVEVFQMKSIVTYIFFNLAMHYINNYHPVEMKQQLFSMFMSPFPTWSVQINSVKARRHTATADRQNMVPVREG